MVHLPDTVIVCVHFVLSKYFVLYGPFRHRYENKDARQLKRRRRLEFVNRLFYALCYVSVAQYVSIKLSDLSENIISLLMLIRLMGKCHSKNKLRLFV